jgi:hypothetical protein
MKSFQPKAEDTPPDDDPGRLPDTTAERTKLLSDVPESSDRHRFTEIKGSVSGGRWGRKRNISRTVARQATLRDVTRHGASMSLGKARDLLRLAEMAASRHMGVSLAEIAEEFDADHRTAQRMTKALEDVFQNVEVNIDEDRRRRWKLRDSSLLRLRGVGLGDSELAALEMGIKRAEREGATHDVKALISLRDRLLAHMPGPHARRAEADAEAVLEAYG